MSERNQHSIGSTSHFDAPPSVRVDDSAIERTSISEDSSQPVLLDTINLAHRRTTVNETSHRQTQNQTPPHKYQSVLQKATERAHDTALSLQGLTSIAFSSSLRIHPAPNQEVSDVADYLLQAHPDSSRIPAEEQRGNSTPLLSVKARPDEGHSPLERYINEGAEERYSLFNTQLHNAIHPFNFSSNSSTQHGNQVVVGPWRFSCVGNCNFSIGAEKSELT